MILRPPVCRKKDGPGKPVEPRLAVQGAATRFSTLSVAGKEIFALSAELRQRADLARPNCTCFSERRDHDRRLHDVPANVPLYEVIAR
jgi:hypothetical protein